MTDAQHKFARHGAWFGLVAAASTSPGQTFFIGLFGDAFRASFEISEATLGTLYGIATLCSGLLMFWLGEIADRHALRRAITLSVGMVSAGALLLAFAPNAAVLAFALFLLRLGGQGLSGHFAVVAAARFSGAQRGRGIAFASFGFILGEAFYPLLVTLALGLAEWRTVWMGVAAILLLVYLPALRWLAAPLPAPEAASASSTGGLRMRGRLLFSAPFLAALGVLLVPPFVITAVFFHQRALGNALGWSMAEVAQAFMLFAVCQAMATFAAGRFVDRFGARVLMRFHLLPLGIGVAGIALLPPEIALWVLFAGVGFTGGSNAVAGGAIWVDVFGTARLGLIRGMYAALMVLSTALSPALLGAALSADTSFNVVFLPVLAYVAVVPWLLAPLLREQAA